MNVLALVTISFVVLKLKKILLHENYKEAAVAIMAFIERVIYQEYNRFEVRNSVIARSFVHHLPHTHC